MKALQDKYVTKSNLVAFSNPNSKELSKEFIQVLDTLIGGWISTGIYTISLTYNDQNSVIVNSATVNNSGTTQNAYLKTYIDNTINPAIKELGVCSLDLSTNKLTFTPKVGGSTSATTASTISLSGSTQPGTKTSGIDSSVSAIKAELEGQGIYAQAGSQAADAAKLKQDTLAALKKESTSNSQPILVEEINRMKKLMKL